MKSRSVWALAVALLMLGGFNIFWNVSAQPVAIWDEARHIASAVEMVDSGDFIINRYQGAPDYWNAKPPLSFWAAAAGYELLPDKTLGVRLFSLLSALLTTVVVFAWVRRSQGVPAGLLAALLLVTAPSLVLKHGMRTADADMLFVLLVTLAMWCASFATRSLLALAYLLLGFAFLAKSFHVAAYGVALFLYAVFLWRRGLLRLPDVLLLPLVFLLPVLAWAMARYQADGTHFFEVMFLYDVLKRSTEVIESHHAPFWFYFHKIGAAFLVPLACSVFVLRQQQARRFFREPHGVLLLLWMVLPLLVYSLASSKLPWYVYPVFPAVAIVAGLALGQARDVLSQKAFRVVAVLVLLNLLVSEARIAGPVLRPRQDPVQATLADIAAGSQGAAVAVYRNDGAGAWEQHHYAAALLRGRLQLMPGGRAAFEKAAQAAVLINPEGLVEQDNRLP